AGAYWMPLFVVLAAGVELDDRLRERIREELRTKASPRHIPDDVIAVPAIPHTRTGKKLEVPVKRLIQGHPLERVANPDAVDSFETLTYITRFAEAGGSADSRPAFACGEGMTALSSRPPADMLIGIDGSDSSRPAFLTAVTIAKEHTCSIRVVGAYSVPVIPHRHAPKISDDRHRCIGQSTQDLLEEYAAEAREA